MVDQPAIEASQLHGRRLAMLAWGKKQDGSDDVMVLTGTGEWDGTHLTMRRDPEPPFRVLDEWIERMQPVDPELTDTLRSAEFFFSVTVGTLPGGASMEQYPSTGLTWPTD